MSVRGRMSESSVESNSVVFWLFLMSEKVLFSLLVLMLVLVVRVLLVYVLGVLS